jgi:hypothetical protein
MQIENNSMNHERVLEMIKLEYSIEKIAKELDSSKWKVWKYLNENNLKTKYCIKNLEGQIFNNLKVIKYADRGKNGPNYLCECICGKTLVVNGRVLMKGSRRSCGCSKNTQKLKDNNKKLALSKIGEKYGLLTIIDVELKKDKYLMVCRCDCGKITYKIYSQIKSGYVKSCGCYLKEFTSNLGSTIGMNNYKSNRKWYFIKGGESISCRSGYEVIYANYLISNKIEFEYEPHCFKLDNGRRYTPDFYLTNENKYIEIKGIPDTRFDKNNQRENREIFKNYYNLDMYYWEDLIKICDLPFKSYRSYKCRAEKFKLTFEEYLGYMLYKE